MPVFYVPAPEFSFLPRHTVCDAGTSGSASEPFARSVFSGDGLTFGGNGLNGAGIDEETLRELRAPSGPYDVPGIVRNYRAVWHIFERSKQEIAHPNVKGYAAETLAILRWTRTRAASDAAAFTKAAKAAEAEAEQPLIWLASDKDLGRLAPGETPVLQGGTTYPLTLAGFAQAVPLRVIVRSTPRVLGDIDADDRGRVDTDVAIPRGLESGRHTLELTGLGADGRARTVRIPFEINRPIRPSVVASMGAVSAGALLLGIFLTWASGHALPGRRHRLVDGR